MHNSDSISDTRNAAFPSVVQPVTNQRLFLSRANEFKSRRALEETDGVKSAVSRSGAGSVKSLQQYTKSTKEEVSERINRFLKRPGRNHTPSIQLSPLTQPACGDVRAPVESVQFNHKTVGCEQELHSTATSTDAPPVVEIEVIEQGHPKAVEVPAPGISLSPELV